MTTNKTFFQTVKEEVLAVPLTDVIEDFTTVKRSNFGDNDAYCPFHADEKFGSFKINDDRSIFKCFSCGEGGNNSIKFVMKVADLEEHEAIIKIAYMHDIISKKQSEELLGGEISSTDIQKVKRKPKVKDDSVVSKAKNEVLDELFRAFIDSTTLSDYHREILMNRGLTEQQIKDGKFFTFPESSNEFLFKFYKLMTQRNLNPQDLKHVPGFVTAEHLRQQKDGEVRYLYTFQNRKGMGIPVINAKGEIVGIQIRKDSVEEGHKRYGWFSSTYAQHKNVYKHGTPAGAPLHTTYTKSEDYKKVVFITEGIFKSISIEKQFKATAISLQGVGNFHEIVTELKDIEQKQGKIEYIFLAHDADMAQNANVYLHMKKLVETVKESFPDITFYTSMWDDAYGKGIDDLIQNGEVGRLRRLDMDMFIEKYDAIIEPLEKEYKKDIRLIKKDYVREAFMRKVFEPLMKDLA